MNQAPVIQQIDLTGGHPSSQLVGKGGTAQLDGLSRGGSAGRGGKLDFSEEVGDYRRLPSIHTAAARDSCGLKRGFLAYLLRGTPIAEDGDAQAWDCDLSLLVPDQGAQVDPKTGPLTGPEKVLRVS